MLVQTFKHCSVDVINTQSKSYCSNRYGCSLCCNYRKETYIKYVVAYNDIYLKPFHIKRGESISSAFVPNVVHTFNIIVHKGVYSMRQRLLESKIVLVHCIGSSLFYQCSNLSYSKTWNNILYTIPIFRCIGL